MKGSAAQRFVVSFALLASALVAACGFASRPFGFARSSPQRMPEIARTVRIFEQHQQMLRDSIVRLALAQVGARYEFGGMTPQRGFDCSGLVSYVFAQLTRTPPRQAAMQARVGAAIQRDNVRPGDLLTFGVGDSITHVGIYVGDRKFVHASSVAGRVIVSSMDRPPSDLIRPLKGARRLLAIRDPIELRMGS